MEPCCGTAGFVRAAPRFPGKAASCPAASCPATGGGANMLAPLTGPFDACCCGMSVGVLVVVVGEGVLRRCKSGQSARGRDSKRRCPLGSNPLRGSVWQPTIAQRNTSPAESRNIGIRLLRRTNFTAGSRLCYAVGLTYLLSVHAFLFLDSLA